MQRAACQYETMRQCISRKIDDQCQSQSKKRCALRQCKNEGDIGGFGPEDLLTAAGEGRQSGNDFFKSPWKRGGASGQPQQIASI
jgi:hypothetical protein